MAIGTARSALVLASVLCLQKPAFSGYQAIYPTSSTVSYSQSSSSGTICIFPNQTNVPTEEYGYFFSELNFDINSRLLTGAADMLYLFDLDLNVQSSYRWEPSPSVLMSCHQTNDNSSYTCRNHIRIFKQLPSNESQLLVCGTQADNAPQCRIVELSGGTIGRGLAAGSASSGLLSYYPEYISFGEFISANSSDERFFSAALGSTDRDFRISFSNVALSDPANPDTLQTAELFKTPAIDRWLDFPVTFVDYFRADYRPVFPASLPEHYQFYFVFLRESLTNADVIYSRVARICRNDPGLTSGLGNQFTTFMKARIFCEREVPPGRQFAGTVDYQYNEIKSMVFNEEGRYAQTTDWVKLMYGAFAGPSIGPVGTAVCVYRADNSVEQRDTGFNRGIFDIFREDLQDTMGQERESMFVECRPEGRTLANSELIQVVQDVSQIGENPLLVLDGLIVTQMAVDQVCVVKSAGTNCVNQDILFMGTDTGKILKVIFVGSTADTTPVIAEEITLDDDNAVNQLSLQRVNDSFKYIYVSTFSKIYRLPLDRCSRLNTPNNVTNSCRSCISSRDPYCVWNVASLTCDSNPLVVQTNLTNNATSNYLQNVHTGAIPPDCTFAEVGFTVASDSVSESLTSYTVTIRSSLDGAVSSGLVEIYTLIDGNATAGIDYVGVSGVPITFSPGSTEATYTITLTPDDVFEGGDEQFTVGLRATGVGGVVISQGELTLNIIEDDAVSLSLVSSEITVSERACFVNVTLIKNGLTTVDSRVLLNTVQNGTAIVGEDYLHVETEVIFSPSDNVKTVIIPLINDVIQEARKWFVVEILLPIDQIGVLLADPAISNITILDDDPVVIRFSEREVTVEENEGLARLSLIKDGETTTDIQLEIILTPGSAGTSDYIAPTSSIVFPAESDQMTIPITLMNDNILEDQESFSAELVVASGSEREGIITNSNITININDDDSATVGFSSTNYASSEGEGPVTITVELSAMTETEVVVELVAIAATATFDDDFSAELMQVTFMPQGPTSLTVPIQIQDDSILEATEYFTIQLISYFPRVSVRRGRANITILDNDAVTVGLTAAEYVASEMDCSVAVEIRLLGSTDVPVTVFLSTSDLTASSGEDYIRVIMTPLFFNPSPSIAIQSVNFQLINDDTVESSEQFEIVLESGGSLAGVSIDRNSTVITIQDSDYVEFGFETVGYSAAESGGVVEVAVVKYGNSSLPLSVRLSTMNGLATSPQDFTPINGQELTFDSVQSRQTVPIIIITDDIFEDVEEFTILLTPISPQSRVVLDGSNTTTIQIIDNDSLIVGFSPAEYIVSEGKGTVLLNVNVNRQFEAASVVVQINVVEGAAMSGADFYLRSSTLEFLASGATSIQVMVDIVDDSIVESLEEGFSLQISFTNSRVVVQQGIANVTIIDDDDVEFGFEAVGYSASESGGVVEVGVVKYGSSSLPLSVRLSTMSDSATSPQDFTPINGQELTFSPSQSRQTVPIAIIDDGVLENAEQFSILLSRLNPQARVMDLLNSSTITISDNDFVSVNLSSMEYMVSEGERVISINVIFGPLQSQVSVRLSAIPGTASGETDFMSQSIILNASTGGSCTVTIQLMDDDILEESEYFTLQLFPADARVLIQQATATVLIMDDDSVSVGFEATSYTASEMDCFIAVNIRLRGSTDIPLNFNLTTTSGIAQAGQDFVRVSKMPLTIYPGTAISGANIQLLNDNFVEKDAESFTVLLEAREGVAERVNIDNNTTTVYIEDDDSFTMQATETSVPPTTSGGVVNERTEGPTSIPVGPGLGSLQDRCIYDSFTTSAAVLAALLAVILLLLVILMICFCVLVKKCKNDQSLKKYQRESSSDLPLGSGSKRPSPDRLPMENFGIPNRVYCENSDSQPNTPALKHIEEDFNDIPPEVMWNSNKNNGNVIRSKQPALPAGKEDSSSSEDLTMTKL